MSTIIKIGTRDSQLALWQAKIVQQQLERLGHLTELVPVKSTGDLVLNKPLYELGITGIFTKTLDIAMLNGDIDIAVHSLKDVPTLLPKGIIQAAVLKRGNANDTLVYKNNEEFLSQKEAIIATGSLRRRAQWLNRYPTHTIVNLRGNVNTRLQKLQDNAWNGAIFAAAGMGRIGVRPENAENLSWMVPAPAQGAIMIAVLDENEEIKEICKQLNHKETEICTTVERQFLRKLEGGCTAPIGALARIKEDTINFTGILLSNDGSKKIQVERSIKMGNEEGFGEFCAEYIIEHGGKRLIDQLRKSDKKQATLYSTKALTKDQVLLLNETITVESQDFVQVNLKRINTKILNVPIEHVIITSKNAVAALEQNIDLNALDFKNIYCVGRRTKKLIEQKIGPVAHMAKNAKALSEYLIGVLKDTSVTYFCSNIRLDDLPNALQNSSIELEEVVAYNSKFNAQEIDQTVKGVMFYSPSTVDSYMSKNHVNITAYCIGESTAKKAREHFKEVKVAKVPTVEGVIELVNRNYV